MNLQLAVFDMVGTTVQAGGEVPSSFREALLSVGVELSDTAIAGVRGRSKREAISDLLAEGEEGAASGPEVVETVYRRFQDSLLRAFRSNARSVPGAEAVFDSLRRAGVRVALTTGLDRDTAKLLVRVLGWENMRLLGPVTGDDVSRSRPAPDLIHAAMRLAGVTDPKAVAVVGDTTSDLDAAATAGVGWIIGVLGGAHTRDQLEAHPHSVVLESVSGLPEWLFGAKVGKPVCGAQIEAEEERDVGGALPGKRGGS